MWTELYYKLMCFVARLLCPRAQVSYEQPPDEEPAEVQQEVPTALPTDRYPLLRSNGRSVQLPPLPEHFKATHIAVENMASTIVATYPLTGNSLDVSSLPRGFYTLRIVNARNVSHRLAFLMRK